MTTLSQYLSSLEKETLSYGSHNENDSQVNLKAGDLSVVYENGNLRYISLGNCEMIRMVYSAVRDREWLTVKPVILDEEIEIYADSFRIRYNCRYWSGEIDFLASYSIEGFADNTLTFSFEGEALSTFEKCRIGFCVLHPVEGCSGNPCIITHSDGNQETLTFPVYISPDQPFIDIKSMKWKAGNSECRLLFSGDIFETEDQRNWTDASYKTYCTPLSVPYPATIRKGEKISQKIKFELTAGDTTEVAEYEDIKISIKLASSSALPSIGIGRSTRPAALTEEELRILRELHFDHYRVDLYLFHAKWKLEADLAMREGARLNYSLELAVFFDENYHKQLEDLIAWITSRKPSFLVISLFHRSDSVLHDNLLMAITPRLKMILPDVKIVCGTNANFAQINRIVSSSTDTDYICYSIHSQEHASDNATIVENLQSQSYTVDSARQFAREKGIWISPVNICRRFNANVENYESQVSKDTFPPQADSRLMSIFGACWTTGSLKYLCEAGVNGITFFETVGERGIMQGSFDSRWPAEFKTVKGIIFPVFHLFAWLLNDKSFKLSGSSSSRPLEVDCLALLGSSRIKLVLANFTSSGKNVLIDGLSGEIRIKRLNAESFAAAAIDFKWIEKNWQNVSRDGEQMILEPYSLTFVEGFFNH